MIAASAGGIEPLRRIVAALPVPCWAAVFAVVHTGAYLAGTCMGISVSRDFFAGRPSSIPPIAAGRHDCGESIEVEIDNDLEGFAGGIVA